MIKIIKQICKNDRTLILYYLRISIYKIYYISQLIVILFISLITKNPLDSYSVRPWKELTFIQFWLFYLNVNNEK